MSKTKKNVLDFEHRAALGKRIQSCREYKQQDLAGHDASFYTGATCYKSDGTHHKAVEKRKVHVSSVYSISCTHDHILHADTEVSADDIPQLDFSRVLSTSIAPPLTAACDLQVIRDGTGVETYWHCLREMESVGCPTFVDRCAKSFEQPHQLWTYVFGLDAGPDNQGMR